MTKSVLVLLLFIIGAATYGQKKVKPVYNEETQEITIDGKYYITMKKGKGGTVNVGLSNNYSIQNKEGIELIFMKYEPRENYNRATGKNETSFWYKISFPETGSWLWKKVILTMSTKGVMKALVKNQLIENGNLNKEMVKRYVQNNDGKFVLPKVNGPSSNLVMVNDDKEIVQDGVVIGKVMERHTEMDRVYHVFDKEGSKVMVAKIAKIDPFEWILTSQKGDSYNVIHENDQDGVKILTYMALKGWLPK